MRRELNLTCIQLTPGVRSRIEIGSSDPDRKIGSKENHRIDIKISNRNCENESGPWSTMRIVFSLLNHLSIPQLPYPPCDFTIWYVWVPDHAPPVPAGIIPIVIPIRMKWGLRAVGSNSHYQRCLLKLLFRNISLHRLSINGFDLTVHFLLFDDILTV